MASKGEQNPPSEAGAGEQATEKQSLAAKAEPEQQEFRPTQRQLLDLMHLMQEEPFSVLEEDQEVDEEEFEDVTEELFKCVDEDLGELEMLLNPKTFNWEEVMTSFEVMDHKMDLRMKRNAVVEQKRELIQELEAMPQEPLSQSKKLALMRELLLQFATWQERVTHLQQSIFSNLFLTRKSYYLSCPDLMPVVEAILYIIQKFYTQVRCTYILKDEDVCAPAALEPLYHLSPKEILDCLAANIQRYETAAKTGGKAQDKLNKDMGRAFKVVQALFVTTMYSFHPRDFQEVFGAAKTDTAQATTPSQEDAPQKPQQEAAAATGGGGKKKKKGKNKKNANAVDAELEQLLDKSIQANKASQEDQDQVLLMKYLENLQLKIFEEKQEKQADHRWARSLSDPNVFHALPLTVSRKIYETLSYKQAQQFYARLCQQVKDLLDVRKQASTRQICSQQLLHFLDRFMKEKPCGLMRLAYERCFCTDVGDPATMVALPASAPGEPAKGKDKKDKGPKKARDAMDYFFGNTFHEIKVADFLKTEYTALHPRAATHWDKHDGFMDFLRNTCLVFRERVRRCLVNATRARRGYKQLFADFAYLLNEAQYVDEDAKLAFEKLEFESMPCTGISVATQAQAVLDYMLKGFELELFCVGEVAQYCGYMASVYEFYAMNRQMHVWSAAGGREMGQRLVNLDDLKNSADKFNSARAGLSTPQKLAVDEFEVSRAMKVIFKGMEALCTALLDLKIIKDVFVQHETDETDEEGQPKPALGMPPRPVDSSYTCRIRENSYYQRQSYVRTLSYPRPASFEEYRSAWKRDRSGMDMAARLDHAKAQLMQGKKTLQNLQETAADMRNGAFWGDQELKDLQMRVVENSLIIAKIKMKMAVVDEKELPTQYYVGVDYEKSLHGLPVLSVVDRK